MFFEMTYQVRVTDPWGNRLGLFEYINKSEEKERMDTILGGENGDSQFT